jgi:hypothetical protein
MSATPTAESLPLQFRDEGANVKAELLEGDRVVSWLWIIPFQMRIGRAVVRMDGIGGVNTLEECRNRGYSRYVIESTLRHMRDERGAALAMLYGIRNYYPKFGFATAGPDHFLILPAVKAGEADTLPAGWQVRPGTLADLLTLHRLYTEFTEKSVGAAVRTEGAGSWAGLTRHVPERGGAELRIVEDGIGTARGYLWRNPDHWYVRQLERAYPEALVLGEAVAADPAAADVVLAAGRAWAAEPQPDREQPTTKLLLASPPEGVLAEAALYQDAETVQRWELCGGSMAAVLDTERLLRFLEPELSHRYAAVGSPKAGPLALRTAAGEVVLEFSAGSVRVAAAGTEAEIEVTLPSPALGRLALGAFPPGGLLSRLPAPPTDAAAELLAILFPQRRPHLHLPDRY